MIVHLKEAGLQIPVLTNRNGIQRLVREGKQAHLCEARNQQSRMGRCRSDRMKDKCLTRGDLERYELPIEKSAEVIVVAGNEPIYRFGGLTRQ